MIKVLLIEDNPGDARLIQLMLEEDTYADYSIEFADNLNSGLKKLSDDDINVILLDLLLPDSQDFNALDKIRLQSPDVPVIVMTGNIDEQQAVQAVLCGAQDYLIKGEVDCRLLNRSICYAIERQRWFQTLIQKNKQLETHRSNLSQLIQETSSGMVIVKPKGIIMFANLAAERIFNKKKCQIIGSIAPFPLVLGESYEYQIDNGHKDGVVVKITVKETYWDNQVAYLVQLDDITEHKNKEQNLKQLALYDNLTGLPNRALLNDRLRQALERGGRWRNVPGLKTMVILMMLDLDGFKGVNDTYGHVIGDLLLKEAARRLRGCLRKSDTIARYGGDEFVLVLENSGVIQNSELIARKIIATINEPFVLNEYKIKISTSIGISLFPLDGKDDNTLIDCADIAMYQAKKEGNAFCFYSNLKVR